MINIVTWGCGAMGAISSEISTFAINMLIVPESTFLYYLRPRRLIIPLYQWY